MAVYNKDGWGSATPAPAPTTTTTTVKPPTTIQKVAPPPAVPPPLVWWFNGRSYTSLAAYQAAVTAYQQAVAAQANQRRLAELARQRQALLVEQNRRRLEAEADLRRRQDRHRAEAEAAARRALEASRLRAALERQARMRAAAEAQRAAQRRAEQQRLRGLAQRGNTLAGETAALLSRRSEAKRLSEDAAEKQRRQAYDTIATQSRQILRGVRGGIGVSMVDDPGRVNRMSPGQQRRNELVRTAESTGNWDEVLRTLAEQSRASNGRHIDTQLLEQVEEKYLGPIQQLRDQFAELVADLQEAERAGDNDALLRLVEDPSNVELYERFIEIFGDGISPGAFTPHQRILEEISLARERAWSAQVGLGAATDAEVGALLDRAERGAVVRTPTLPGRGPRPIDEQYADLTFNQQVLDPDTGEMRTVQRTGIDAWLAREQVREADRVEGQWRQQQRWAGTFRQLLDAEDMELDSVGGGRVVLRDKAVERMATQIREWLPDWQLNADGLPVRIAQAAGNPGAQEQMIREFMADAARAYDEHNGTLRRMLAEAGERHVAEAFRGVEVPAGSRGGMFQNAGAMRGSQAYERAKTAWLSALAERLGKAEWGALEQLSTTGIGGIAQGALTAFSTIPALIRNRLQQDFGDVQPHLEIPLPWDEGSGFRAGQSADPLAEAQRRALAATFDGQGTFFDQVGAWASVIRDGAQWGSGNLGGALTTFTDPFMFVGPARFTRAGSLAMARAGGLAGLRQGGVGQLVSDYIRYAAPKALGGAGRDVVKIEMAKVSLARKLNLSSADALNMSDDEFRQLVDDVAANRTDELLRSDTIKQLTQATGIEKNQLLNMVQQELPRILREYKIDVEDPFEAARRIRTIRAAAQRARSEAEQAEQLVRMEEERRVAIEALAEVTGRPLAPARMSAEQAARHTELVARYGEAAREYAAEAQRGLQAAEEIAAGTAHRHELRGLHAQVKRSAEALKRHEDQYIVDQHGLKRLDRRGVVGRRFDQLREFRGGGDPTAPSFVDQSMQQVRFDERRIKAMIRETLRQLKATPLGQELSAELKARLRQLELARRGLVYERALLDEGRTLMRPYVRKHMDRVERAIAPQRVAPLAADEAQLATEIGRDFMRQLHGAQVRRIATMTPAEEEAFGRLRVTLTRQVDVAQVFGADRARGITQALGRAPSVAEAWMVLRMAVRDEVWSVELRQALRSLDAQIVAAARRAGFDFAGLKMREAADRLWDIVRDQHSRAGREAVGLEGYTALDRSVEQALVTWRQRVAEGQVRLRERRFRPAEGPARAVFHDTDPYENLVKLRTLGGDPDAFFAYDELRGVLRKPMLRQGSARGILERARARGGNLDEALKAERADVARHEVVRNVEEFATRPELQGLPPETRLRAFEERMLLDDLPESAGVELSPFQIASLERAFSEQVGFDFADKARLAEYFQAAAHDVLGSRSGLFRWMQDNGYWSPRTGESIREGERVWSVAQERDFFEGFMGYTPPWTDEGVLAAVLNDPRLHEAMLREWGFFDDDYELLAASSDLVPKETVDAVVWGREGFRRQRTATELRDWAIQRYGELVSPDGQKLVRMPWLMRADEEYLDWTRAFFDDALGGSQRAALEEVRDRLPESVRKHLFDGDQLSRAGMEIDPRLVKAKEIEKLRDAVTNATRRRLDRLTKSGDVEPGEWLAQEQLRFAYDVTDQLLVDPVWRGLLRGTPVAGAVLRAWGTFWRLLVSWQPAFPIMNLIESFGFKRLYLTIYEGGLRPLSIESVGRRVLPGDTQQVLRAIEATSESLFHVSGGSPWIRVGDRYLTAAQRGRALVRGVAEIPVQISRFGEDRLRADFARRVAGDTFRTARRQGLSVEAAEQLARKEAKRLVESFFAVSQGRGWQTALNELVPFFSYNFKNKTLALRMLWQHPSVWVWGERIRREVEAFNREQWAQDHPGVPFPEGPSASWLWWKVGDDYYKIDLSAFSDWTRAIGHVAADHTALGWFYEFIRVPHPSQLGALAIFTGDQTPWGNPGHVRELSFWADLFYWTRGMDYSDPRKQRDFIQIMSQMLFFKKFGHVGAMDVKQQTFFALRQLDEATAAEYLEANPDLQLYWDSLPPRHRIKGFEPVTTIHYRQLMTEEQNREYDAAFEAFDALNARLDAEIAEHAAQPWTDEYKVAKRNAAIARRVFLLQNPILTRAWGTFMSPERFAELRERSVVDYLADAWYNWQRPRRDQFENDLDYQRALVAYNERRQAFLEAHPNLAERLMEGRTAVETAWREQELHWTDVLDFQARLKIRILEEEAKGDASDPDLIDLLYRVRELAGAELSADRYGMFESPVGGGGRIFAALPGFADLQYLRASPEERKQLERDDWYFRTLKDISRQATSGKHWFELAHANPAFLQEYWARNPDKKAEFEANSEYIRWIGSWARKLQASDFDGAQATWDQMPAWIKERYFAKHPDSKMRDGAGSVSTAVQYKGLWFKSPESRDRYIRFVENGGSSADFPDGFAESTGFRSPESRQRFLDGQAYFASIGRWVEMLKAKDFVGADAYFRSLPAWMKEKYYAKHPDQRAKNDLDSAALRYGAEYFLATGDDKLAILAKYPQLRAWLAEHGGDEGAMRGLISAMYRAIPSTEPWLRRVFRERFPEVFGVAAAGERKLRRISATLAEHPEMLPFYERALKLQTSLYLEQLKLSKVPPKPVEMERRRRLVKRGKRRAARLHSRWTLHRDLRRYAG